MPTKYSVAVALISEVISYIYSHIGTYCSHNQVTYVYTGHIGIYIYYTIYIHIYTCQRATRDLRDCSAHIITIIPVQCND